MSDDQIATALGQIMGEMRSMRDEFRRYTDAHDRRHSEDRERADARHRVIDETFVEHAAEINQAKGAKGAVVAMAAAVSTLIGIVIAFVRKLF